MPAHNVHVDRADDQVREAIVIDVAGRRHRPATLGIELGAVELEAINSVEARKVEIGGKPAALAVHHIARATLDRGRAGQDRVDRSGEAGGLRAAGPRCADGNSRRGTQYESLVDDCRRQDRVRGPALNRHSRCNKPSPHRRI